MHITHFETGLFLKSEVYNMIQVYGIPNCDSVRKALLWLKQHKVDFTFHDFKKEGITAAELKKWSAKVGWEMLLNKKSTTWRGLSAHEQSVTTQAVAVQRMKQYPSLIKRPVIVYGEELMVGYNEEAYTKKFK